MELLNDVMQNIHLIVGAAKCSGGWVVSPVHDKADHLSDKTWLRIIQSGKTQGWVSYHTASRRESCRQIRCGVIRW